VRAERERDYYMCFFLCDASVQSRRLLPKNCVENHYFFFIGGVLRENARKKHL
jgi:hypothetical protein